MLQKVFVLSEGVISDLALVARLLKTGVIEEMAETSGKTMIPEVREWELQDLVGPSREVADFAETLSEEQIKNLLDYIRSISQRPRAPLTLEAVSDLLAISGDRLPTFNYFSSALNSRLSRIECERGAQIRKAQAQEAEEKRRQEEQAAKQKKYDALTSPEFNQFRLEAVCLDADLRKIFGEKTVEILVPVQIKINIQHLDCDGSPYKSSSQLVFRNFPPDAVCDMINANDFTMEVQPHPDLPEHCREFINEVILHDPNEKDDTDDDTGDDEVYDPEKKSVDILQYKFLSKEPAVAAVFAKYQDLSTRIDNYVKLHELDPQVTVVFEDPEYVVELENVK